MSSDADRARARAYYQAHKKEYKKYVKENPQVHLRSQLKRLYKMTLEQYMQMLSDQDGACAICKRPAAEFPKAFAVDHDHETGAVRGLLCPNCNHGLGRFLDNVETVRNAVIYLERSINGRESSNTGTE